MSQLISQMTGVFLHIRVGEKAAMEDVVCVERFIAAEHIANGKREVNIRE